MVSACPKLHPLHYKSHYFCCFVANSLKHSWEYPVCSWTPVVTHWWYRLASECCTTSRDRLPIMHFEVQRKYGGGNYTEAVCLTLHLIHYIVHYFVNFCTLLGKKKQNVSRGIPSVLGFTRGPTKVLYSSGYPVTYEIPQCTTIR